MKASIAAAPWIASHFRMFRKGRQSEEEAEDEDDVLGQLAFVAGHLETLDKETVALVIKAAIAEIIDLRLAARMQAALAGGGNADG